MKKDPVCNMEVREENALTTECDGEFYYFCSEGCRDKFLQERTCKLAAGDVTNAFGKRIIIASGEGAKAALAARQYLLNFKKIMTLKHEKID